MNDEKNENALYEPPTFEEMGSFRDATGMFVVVLNDPATSYGVF
jgi:hypothetical protein